MISSKCCLLCRITSTAKWGLYEFINNYFSSSNITGKSVSERYRFHGDDIDFMVIFYGNNSLTDLTENVQS